MQCGPRTGPEAPTLTQDNDEEPVSALQTGRAAHCVRSARAAEVYTVTLQVWLPNTFSVSVNISVKNTLAFRLPTVLPHS